MKAGAVAIESSTLSPEWVRQLAGSMRNSGVELLDAMVSGSTPQAESAQLVFLSGVMRSRSNVQN
jgi:3-hydroxyisobutyrate dehydrogenase